MKLLLGQKDGGGGGGSLGMKILNLSCQSTLVIIPTTWHPGA